MQKNVKFLLLEDSHSDADLIQQLLHGHHSFKADVRHFRTLESAIESLGIEQYDLVLADLGLPDSFGLETISRLRSCAELVPIIAMTSEASDLGLNAIRAGANDFIPKDELSKTILGRAVGYTIERFAMTRELEETNEMLEAKNNRLASMYDMSQQFVDNVSHEFRTPLTVIREFAAIVRDGIDGPVTAKQEKRLSTLINRTDDLALMVDDLLDTSRIKSGLLKTCRKMNNLGDVVSYVESMLKHRAEAKQISLTVHSIPAELQVFCDHEKLRRILINLVVNAIKFTPVGGSIQISSSIEGADRVKITVSDNGHGIAKEDLNLIFNRFQQVSEHERMASCKGFGLGLSIARSLASLNLGSLQVSSVEGQGSQFSVVVPAARVDAVLNCYLDQRESLSIADEEINVVEVRLEILNEDDQDVVFEAVDDFLRSSVKNFDLVVKSGEGRWLMYTNNSETSVIGLIKRFEREWSKLQRDNFGTDLPLLLYDSLGSVKLQGGRQRLLKLAGLKSEMHSSTTESAASRKKILIVDDEQEIANTMHARLARIGFDVQTFRYGFDGLEAAQDTKPDAILLDVSTPEMDGLKMLDTLKSIDGTRTTPVIMLSASRHDQQHALDRGANFFFRTPFKFEAVVAAINSAIQQTESSLLPTSSQQEEIFCPQNTPR